MKFVAPLLLATLAATSLPASAQFAKPEDAVKYRQSVMFVMSQHLGRLGAMANGRVPFDGKAAQENAEVLEHLARLPWTGFVPGTDKVGNTKAKPEIWSEAARFKETNDKLMAETTKLVAAAKTNNVDNLKSAFQATAGTCKSCHDNFRRD